MNAQNHVWARSQRPAELGPSIGSCQDLTTETVDLNPKMKIYEMISWCVAILNRNQLWFSDSVRELDIGKPLKSSSVTHRDEPRPFLNELTGTSRFRIRTKFDVWPLIRSDEIPTLWRPDDNNRQTKSLKLYTASLFLVVFKREKSECLRTPGR